MDSLKPSSFDPRTHPHRRYNPLLDEWVLVSPHRTQRPWLGQTEPGAPEVRPQYDETCYLCPGNARANGETNPAYESTFVFANDFPSLLPGAPGDEEAVGHPLFQAAPAYGECRVLCFAPRHDLTLAKMSSGQIEDVVRLWKEQAVELGDRYRWVQIFENKGASMGCSNPHPHGQIWASDFCPTLLTRENDAQWTYFMATERRLLADVAEAEVEAQERLVEVNEQWIAFVPFWATWPFELCVLPRTPISRMGDLPEDAVAPLADLLRKVLCRYDNLFQTSFPYSFGWHWAPADAEEPAAWVLHAHLYPPLLRSSTVRKFMVGYEMLAEAQRDLTPEQAAERLGALPTTHYSERK